MYNKITIRIFKYLILSILGFISIFLIIIYFSEVKSNFQCFGKISYKGNTRPITIYVKLAEYRWWVGLWGDGSDGYLNLEIPNTWVDYYGYIEESGDQRFIYDYEKYPQKTLKGNFSILSKTLTLDTAMGFFDGVCSVVD
jgi:hypothetical protein